MEMVKDQQLSTSHCEKAFFEELWWTKAILSVEQPGTQS